MVVGEMPDGVDLLVVGGGPGGYVAALAGAQLGREVVLVDADGESGLGGACVNVGCIPSKALIELANARHGLDSWSKRGLTTTSQNVDMAAFQAWKGETVLGLNRGVRQLLAHAGVNVRQGYFRFTRKDQGALELGDAPPNHIKFKSCVLATGSRPATLPHLHRDGERIIDSTDALALADLPQRIAVVGGGYIGIELGTALAKLGSKVTIVEAANRILPTLSKEISATVGRRLTQLGATVLTNTTVTADDGTSITLKRANHTDKQIKVDKILITIGRIPNTDDLGLDALRVTAGERGLLNVGPDRLLTPQVAAIGDITAGPALAHKSSAEAHVAVDVLSGRPNAFDPTTISAVVFSDPEVATTGLTLAEAQAQGADFEVATFPVAASGRARTLNETAGFTQWVYSRETGVVVGAQIVCPHASELIAEAALAIEMGANLDDIAETIHPHPTMGETLPEAARVGLGKPIHVAVKKP